MPDLITFADKVNNTAATSAAASLPENEKIGATDINALKDGVNTNNAAIETINSKLSGIQDGAQVNQSAFSTIAVAGQNNVVAEMATDTLNLIAGTNITITTNSTNDSITINSTASGGGGGDLLASNNLSDLADVSIARTNLGLEIGTDIQAHSAILDATTASFTTADKTKIDLISITQDLDLDAVETTTELNTRDTNNRNRANHTGTQTTSTISDFNSAVDARLVIDSTNFQLLSSTTPQDLWAENDEVLTKDRGTEVISGTGAVAFTVGQTVFNVGTVTGQIKDDIGYYPINFAGATNVSLISTLVTSVYVYIDKNNTLQQQTTAPTNSEFRSKLFLTRLALSGNTLVAQEEIANPSGQYANNLRDYLSYIKSPKKGLQISPNSNLTFQVAAGSIFEFGVNNSSQPNNPNETSFSLQNPASFFYVSRNAYIANGQTNINVTEYDNNGTLTALTNNKFKIMTVFKFNSGNHVVQEGQNQYNSIDEAQLAISTRNFVQNPINDNGTRIGWIIVLKDATDLSNPAQAKFIQDEGAFNTSVGIEGALLASNNLSDLTNAATARQNLGLISSEQTLTASGNIASTTKTALVNSASDVIATLPLANTVPIGIEITVKRLGTGNVIVGRSGSDTIDTNATNYNFDTDSAVQYSARTFRSNGVNGWYIV